MTGAVIVASHLPGEGHFHSDRYEVRPVLCDDDFDYWAGLAEAWESNATLINVEHDLECTDEHISRLLGCPHPLCSHAYQCHWASTHLPHDVWAARNGADTGDTGESHFISEREPWAAQSAIGLIKVTRPARIGPLTRRPWSHLELSVEQAVRRPWHMHWDPPLHHHHW